MVDENDTVRVSPAPLPWVLARRVIPRISAARPIAGIVTVFLGIVSATSVIGASTVPLESDPTSETVPESSADARQPCVTDASTMVTDSTTVAPTTAIVFPTDTTIVLPTDTTTVLPTVFSTDATTVLPTVLPTDTTSVLPTDTTTETTTEVTTETTEVTTGGVEPCLDASTDPLEPTVPSAPPASSPTASPAISPATPLATSLDGSAPTPEIAAPTAVAAEPPAVATTSGQITAPPVVAPPVVAPPVVAPPVVAPPVVAPPVITQVSIATPPPALLAVNAMWTTGVVRSGAPRGPGPTAPRLGRTPAGQRVVLADHVEVILATIRQLESGGRYDIGPNKAKASGAYQYIPSTWRNEGGYSHAYLAPAEVQDARARSDVERFLAMYGGDVSMVPVMWYYPRAASDPKWMDRVPNPAGGNRLTIREYQTRWLELLSRNAQDLLGSYVPVPEWPAAVSVLTAFPEPPDAAEVEHPRFGLTAVAARPAAAVAEPGVVAAPFIVDAATVSDRTMEYASRSIPPEASEERSVGSMRSIVFPVLGPVAYANGWGDPRDGGERRHEGTDIIGVPMQPLLAATDGQITQLRLEPRGRSGVAISIRDADGWRYNYFHANNDTPASDDGAAEDGFRLAPGLELGDEVIAGQIIGYMGDSGNAEDSVPHLHFEFRDPRGRPAPSFWSLKAAEARLACTIGIGPWSTPSLTPEVELETVEHDDADTGDGVEPGSAEPERAVRHTVVTPMYGEGQWVIDSDGRVTATGDAALVMPSRTLECAPGPATPFGTDAGGWARFDPDALTGTVLDGADLTDTVLDGADRTDTVFDRLLAGLAMTEVHDPLLEPMVFTDPASGERVVVTFGPSVDESRRLAPTADRPTGSPAALGPTGRREPRNVKRLGARMRRTNLPS